MKSTFSSTERVSQYRARLRHAGMRKIELWVPDTRNPTFQAEARRQCKLLNSGPQEEEILAFIEKTADLRGWE